MVVQALHNFYDLFFNVTDGQNANTELITLLTTTNLTFDSKHFEWTKWTGSTLPTQYF